MVRDDLLLSAHGFPGHALEPVREPLVQLGAPRLRDRLVRRVADQQVPEAEGVLARERRARRGGSAPCARAPSGPTARARARPRVRARGPAPTKNVLTDHGRRLEHDALLRREAVEPRGQQRLDRRRDRDGRKSSTATPPAVLADEASVVDQHRERLLDEQRVALGRSGDALDELVGELRPTPRRFAISVAGLFVGERLERHGRRVQLAAAPRRAVASSRSGARHAHQQDRRAARPVRDVLDAGRGTWARPSGCRRTRAPAVARGRAPRRSGGSPRRSPPRPRASAIAHELRHAPADELLVLVALEHRADLRLDDLGQVEVGEPGGLLDRLDHRAVRDALAVGQAPSRSTVGAAVDDRQELLDQTGLPDARGPEDREELAGASPRRPPSNACRSCASCRSRPTIGESR